MASSIGTQAMAMNQGGRAVDKVPVSSAGITNSGRKMLTGVKSRCEICYKQQKTRDGYSISDGRYWGTRPAAFRSFLHDLRGTVGGSVSLTFSCLARCCSSRGELANVRQEESVTVAPTPIGSDVSSAVVRLTAVWWFGLAVAGGAEWRRGRR